MSFWDKFKEIFGETPVNIGEVNRQALGPSSGKGKTQSSVLDDIEITDEYKKVFEWLRVGAPIVFVSGKAGTGKTTFIRYLRQQFDKNLVVVAPTGVAALNIQGVTIHSFFRFPPRVITDQDIVSMRDRKLYSKISLLVIDEVSMVRSDVIDAIDKFLRKNRDNPAPFGGVQLLLVGDLFQLPPVVDSQERDALQFLRYESSYFFSAKSLRQSHMASQNLTKVYRQSDANFIDLLDKIRHAEQLDEVLPLLNDRCVKDGDLVQTSITLTCTNKVADHINDDQLGKLSGDTFTFMGDVHGKFSVKDTKLPTPINLSLKIGAQVMFTKNDDKKRWVNGTLGKIVQLTQNIIRVEIPTANGSMVYDVLKTTWESITYKYDHISERIVPEVTGTYIQYPLMLAWAVTIHKGQGKTLEKVRVDLGEGAFDFGQVYVALSRCRSLEDIHLIKPIKARDVKCDPVVKRFYVAIGAN
jgi:ATP-dependent DNA helicase PIF1